MTDKNKRKKTFYLILIIGLLVVVAIFFYFYYYNKQTRVDIYGASLDSSTIEIENNFIDIKEKFGDKLKLRIHLLALRDDQGNYVSYLETGDEYSYGQSDLEEVKRQLVIQKYYNEKYLDYLKFRNNSLTEASWQSAAQAAFLDAGKIEKKVEEGKGEELLDKEIENYQDWREKNKNIETLPLILLNDQVYEGAVDLASLSAAAVKPILRGVKDRLDQPAEFNIFGNKLTMSGRYSFAGINECYSDYDCNDKEDLVGSCANVSQDDAYCKYQKPEVTELTVLTDDACLSCDDEQGIATLKKSVKGLEAKIVDIDSATGQQLKNELAIEALPVYLFDQRVQNTENFSYLTQAGLLVQVGEEDNTKYLVTNVMPLKFLNREIAANKLDLLVASSCPFSVMAENALIENLNNLSVDQQYSLQINFLLNSLTKDDGMREMVMGSPRGEEEINENKRQAVIQHHYPDKFFAYLLARNADLNSGWEQAVATAGLNSEEVAVLTETEGDAVLREQAELAFDFGLTGVPAYFWENQQIVLNIDDLKKLPAFAELAISDSDLGVCQAEVIEENQQ